MQFNAKCPGCGHSDPCGCNDPYSTKTNSDKVRYTGPNLPCTGISTCDDFTVVVQKIDQVICQILATIAKTTTTTTTTSIPITTTTTTTAIPITTTTTTTAVPITTTTTTTNGVITTTTTTTVPPTTTTTTTTTSSPTTTTTTTLTPTTTTTTTPTPTTTTTTTVTPTTTTTTTTTTLCPDCRCYAVYNEGDPANVNTTTYTDCNGEPASLVNLIFNANATYVCATFGTIIDGFGITSVTVVDNEGTCNNTCPSCTTTTTTTAPIYRSILLSNPPGETSPALACAITTGLTKYVSASFEITNGLIIYNDMALTVQTYTSDPYSGNYAMLYDNNNALRYAVTFDGSGVVNTVNNCT